MSTNPKDSSKNVESDQVQNPQVELSLTVKAQDGSVICFKLKKSTQLKKLMESYCQRHGVIFSSLIIA